jgi:hypothetical protein
MIRQNLVNDALASLRDYFGPRLLLFPPIRAGAFERLIEIVGRLPSDLIAFLNVCDGLRIDVVGGEDVRLWGTPQLMACALDPASSIVPRCFLPLRGDPTGARDWIITECEPLLGAIVRWDPWTPTIQLIASSLGCYLAAWADYLRACYGPDGRIRTSHPQSPFGATWIKDDPNLSRLNHNAAVAKWLGNVAAAATCSDPRCSAKMGQVLCGPMFHVPCAP